MCSRVLLLEQRQLALRQPQNEEAIIIIRVRVLIYQHHRRYGPRGRLRDGGGGMFIRAKGHVRHIRHSGLSESGRTFPAHSFL